MHPVLTQLQLLEPATVNGAYGPRSSDICTVVHQSTWVSSDTSGVTVVHLSVTVVHVCQWDSAYDGVLAQSRSGTVHCMSSIWLHVC